MSTQSRVGVLALQGDFAEHIAAMAVTGCEVEAVKTPAAVAACDGLIIPGGESTTIGKLCERFGVGDAILALHAAGKPIWGTCAGMILLAKHIVGSDQWRLGMMDISARRNAFGRQVDSFETNLPVAAIPGGPVRAVFIRAPFVTRVFEPAQVLATHGGKIVMARQGTLLASAFHPELTADRRVQEYFLQMVKEAAGS
jgi:5'-phosphate synthase pdxT subunit